MEDFQELLDRIGSTEPPSDEELNAARTELADAARTAAQGDNRDLDAAKALLAGVKKIDAELNARREAAEAEEAEARELLSQLGDAETEDADVETDADETPEPDAAPESRREREPVAASSTPRINQALSRVRARTTTEGPQGNSMVSVMTLGLAQRDPLPTNPTLSDAAEIFGRSLGRVPKGTNGKFGLIRVEYDYPEDRRLVSTNRADNDKILDAARVSPTTASERAAAVAASGGDPLGVAAAGGICGPLPADFSNPFFGTRGRPIRDALPRFQGVSRTGNGGGVRFSPAMTMANLAGSTGVWTIETDEDPGETEKACLVLECEDEQVAYVDAVTACLQVGNFQARFNPEFWRSTLELLMVRHDRLAEQTLYAQMLAAASLRTYTGTGSIYSVLSAISKADAGIRSRLRLDNRAVMNVVMPAWVRNALRDDINRQRLGSSPSDQYGSGVGDAVIDQFFRARNIRPVYSLDLDVFGTPVTGTAALLDYPGGDAELLVYPEGAYFFLDGGTLDLGTEIIDSTLVRQNNRMAFLETFEQAVFRGGEAIAVTVSIDEVCTPCADTL